MKTFGHIRKQAECSFSSRNLRRARSALSVFTAVVACFSLSACFSVKTEHRVEPIQITMDVNVRLERELEASFGELDARSREIAAQQTEKGTE